MIIDEAIRMIGTSGSRGFTIQGLAAECGLSNAGLLYHFGSKDGLLLALIDEIERREADALTPLLSALERDCSSANGYDDALLLLRHMIERQIVHPELGRFILTLQAEAMSPGHAAHRWFMDRTAETESLFSRLLASWAPPGGYSARLVLALMQGLIRRWFEEAGSFDLGAYFEEGVRALVPFRRDDRER
jgi:AcrR family transcriptional regulator